MQKAQAILPLVVIAALVALLVNRPGTNEFRRAQSGQSRSADSSSASAARFSHHLEDDDLDTLDVIGQSLGTDVTSDGLRYRILRAIAVIAEPERFPNYEWRSCLDLLNDVLTLPIRGKNLSKARAVAAALADCKRPDDNIPNEFKPSRACQAHAHTVRTFLTDYLSQDGNGAAPPDSTAKPVTLDFAIDKNDLKLAVLRRAAHEQGIEVQFLIATLPDPIDSYTGWQFDPMLDAIAQAISASDFVLDRFHFPDSDAEEQPADKPSSGSHRLHEVEPGVVIFRKHVSEHHSAPTRLALLIAHENPSAGVHIRPLAAAIRLVVKWRNGQAADKQSAKEPIRILGPTFSGTSDSIVRALQLVQGPVTNGGYRVRFISGSATDPYNKPTIESAFDPPKPESDNKPRTEPAPHPKRIRFQATVQPDNRLVPRLTKHLEDVGWSFPIAVLFEANTQYGRAIWDQMLSAPENSPLSAPENLQMRSDSKRNERRLIQLPFPMNLSRLRATVQADQTPSVDASGQPTRFRSLSMEEMGNPVDKLPQFHPNTAAAYGELAVAEMLQTMRQEHVKTVALLATDPRDKLFLAQQIARNAPDMSIVTVESESLYIHPDYASYLQGALVASTYPLYSANQVWSYGYEGVTQRRHFANGAAQGIYNAAIALLNYDEDGNPLPRHDEGEDKTPRLLEYGPPGAICPPSCQPPVWISVIGRGTAWPVAAYPQTANDPYVFMVQPKTTMHAVPAILPSPWFTAMFLLLTASVAGLWVHARKTWWAVPKVHAAPQREAADGGYSPAAGERGSMDAGSAAGAAGAEIPVTAGLLPYQVACIFTLVVIELFIALVFGTRLFVEFQTQDKALRDVTWLGVVALGVVSVSLLLLLDLLRRVAREGNAGQKSATAGRPSLRLAVVVTPAVVLCAWAFWSLGHYLLGDTLSEAARVGFVTRAMNLESGVSPTLPIVFLGLVILLWALIELARRRRPRVELANDEIKPLLKQAMLGDMTPLQKPWQDAASSMLNVPRSLLMVALIPLAITCIFSFDPFANPLISVEGVWLGRFISTTLLLVQCMLLLALLQFVFLWSKLHELLDRLSWHDMSAAYERIPRNLFPTDLLPRMPRLIELQPLVAQWQRCVHAAGWGSTRKSQTLSSDCFEVTGTFEQEMTLPDRTWATSRTWRAVVHAVVSGMETLRGELISAAGPRAVFAATRSAPGEGGQASAHAVQLYAVGQAEPALVAQAHEDLIAMSMTLVIRDALARLGQNLVFVIVGVLLVFCSHTLFPFQASQRLQLLGWIYVGLTFTAILTVLVQMKRNEIISRLTAAAPGQRAIWDGAFVLKLAVFGLLPLLTLFAAQFPDLGGTLLRWLEPVQKALP